MPIKLVDSNFLRRPELKDYLEETKSNKVLICDVVSREFHKCSPIITAQKSTVHLKDNTSQVLIAIDSSKFLSKKIESANDARLLICNVETKFFPIYCCELHRNPVSKKFVDHMKSVQAEAVDHLDRLKSMTSELENEFSILLEQFTRDEVKIIQRRKRFTMDIMAKIFKQVDFIAASLIRQLVSDKEKWPDNILGARNTFAYRYSLCMMLLYCRWVHYGKNKTTLPKHVLNDVLDMQIVGISTFFGGVLSNDMKLNEINREARFLLRRIGAYLG